ncbi:hypothetical protein [Nocardia salmonicida]|uniref:hypothetical protein n=1 Tax=Nocardia salmonicida TaxID=53431 RepID=UPI0033C98CE4
MLAVPLLATAATVRHRTGWSASGTDPARLAARPAARPPRTWADLIDEREEQQLRFFKDALNYDASREHAIDYVNTNFPEQVVRPTLRVANE